jgi:hypothetical protein
MTKITTDHPSNNWYYLPHHGVIKESSDTTKLRVVFDGSAFTIAQVSLNDTLHTGPKPGPGGSIRHSTEIPVSPICPNWGY